MIDACPVPNVNEENQEHVVHIQGIKEKKETKKCLPLARGETWTKRNDVLGQEYLESVWQFAEVCEDWNSPRCLERSIDHLLTFPRRNLPSPQIGHMFGKTINSEEVCGLSEFRSTVTVCGEERRRKVPLRREDEENYRISPDPLETVCASFHQQSGRRGLSKYRGSQCTSMALGAVLVSKSIPVNYWGTKELDGILKFGDRFHAEQLSKLERDLLDTRLALHEIKAGENHSYRVPIPCPKSKWFDKNYSKTGTIFFSKSAEFYGPIQQSHDCSGLEDLGESRLDVAVRTVLDQGYDGAIITVGNVSGAIIRDLHGRLRYFDSHCNNKIGRMCLDGTAVLLAFDSVEAFVRHIRKRERQSKCRYELVGVNVHLAQECGEDQRSD